MNDVQMSWGKTAVVASALLLLWSAAHAQSQAWPPPPPVGDDRVVISQIAEDVVIIGTPYNYSFKQHQADFVHEWAEWACSLYQRTPVPITFYASNPQCDAIGLAAERSPECWHDHMYACTLPPLDLSGKM